MPFILRYLQYITTIVFYCYRVELFVIVEFSRYEVSLIAKLASTVNNLNSSWQT